MISGIDSMPQARELVQITPDEFNFGMIQDPGVVRITTNQPVLYLRTPISGGQSASLSTAD